ncbi:hypothetical protein LIER_00523 [Lithospermum erythrorhizon]|uniref:Transmembrane protein n=1 Tax=Lithospermum erythrorhizon TaxID=34254 RepID=A0AAV3NK56_LITER
MSSNHLKILKFSLIIMIIMNQTTSEPDQTIYTLLSTHNLPTGIFPKGITNYTLTPTPTPTPTATPVPYHFEFHLSSSSCHSKFETSLRYDSKVSGVIKVGKIEDLKGMAAQELFLWLPVEEIKVDVPSSGLIYFDVGVVNKQFLASYFEDPVECVVSSGGEEERQLVDVALLRRQSRVIRRGVLVPFLAVRRASWSHPISFLYIWSSIYNLFSCKTGLDNGNSLRLL